MFLAFAATALAKPISVPVLSHGPLVAPYTVAHAPVFAHAPLAVAHAPVAVKAEDYDPHPQYSYAYDIKVSDKLCSYY